MQELLLVDFENVQRVDLSRLDEGCHAIRFVGASQKAIPIELVTSAQKLGPCVEWQKIEGNGKNALVSMNYRLPPVHKPASGKQTFVCPSPIRDILAARERLLERVAPNLPDDDSLTPRKETSNGQSRQAKKRTEETKAAEKTCSPNLGWPRLTETRKSTALNNGEDPRTDRALHPAEQYDFGDCEPACLHNFAHLPTSR